MSYHNPLRIRASAWLVWAVIACSWSCGDSKRSATQGSWQPADNSQSLHPVHIVGPEATGKLRTRQGDVDGNTLGVGCVTCHASLEGAGPSIAARNKDVSFHAEIKLDHGSLECSSCHRRGALHTLALASEEPLSIEESMRLCSQCHGLIRRAYDHGAHGGMRGYWDRQRGPQERNDCIACHNPHSPAHPQITPVPGPKDRRPVHEHNAPSVIEERFQGEQP